MSSRQSFEYLTDMNNNENLEIVEADLRESSSWLYAFSGGVEFVIHVASPYKLKSDDPQNDLFVPIVLGSQRIAEMCKNTKSVKKLIVTSCICSLADEFENSKEYNDNDWNTVSTLERNAYLYWFSIYYIIK
jgi:dihydroflavonol-4-reductase